MTSFMAYLHDVSLNWALLRFFILELMDFLWLAKSFCWLRNFPAASLAACCIAEAECRACLYL